MSLTLVFTCHVCVCVSLQVRPVDSEGKPVGDKAYVRTGLIGFLGPVS